MWVRLCNLNPEPFQEMGTAGCSCRHVFLKNILNLTLKMNISLDSANILTAKYTNLTDIVFRKNLHYGYIGNLGPLTSWRLVEKKGKGIILPFSLLTL